MSANPDDAGFTMVEAAAAIAIVSVLAGLAAAFCSGGLRAIDRAQSAAQSAVVLLKLESSLRRAAGEVRIPYWERRAAIDIGEGSASVPFLGGDPKSRLELNWDDRSLGIAEAGRSERFSPLRVTGIGPMPGKSGEARGIEVELLVGSKSCSIAAPFGQCALSLGKE